MQTLMERSETQAEDPEKETEFFEMKTIRHRGENMHPAIQHGDYLKVLRIPLDPEDTPGGLSYFITDDYARVAYLHKTATPGIWKVHSVSEELMGGTKRFEDYEIPAVLIQELYTVKLLLREFGY